MLPFTSSHAFMKSDAKSLYFSEHNSDFIEETGLDKYFQDFHDFQYKLYF
jgi:hypothetical protein